MEENIEKNKQVLEFATIIEEAEQIKHKYSYLRNMFIEFLEYVNMSWDEYKGKKTKEQIIKEYKYFSDNVYLPF